MGFYAAFCKPVARMFQAGSWEPTPCRIISSQVGRHPGSKGGQTYSVDITYNYAFIEQSYTSSQYDFAVGSDSGYAGKQAIVQQYRPGTTATCYVNPKAPEEAVLSRRFRAQMLFGLFPLIFMLVGGGGIVWAVRTPRVAARKNAILEGAQPWHVREDWKTGRIRSSANATLRFFWLFTIVWNVISTVALVAVLSESGRRGDGPRWLILLFPTIGVGMLIATMHATLRWLKFGRAIFEMTSMPAVPGGVLEGTIRLGEFIRPETDLRVKLCCVHRVTTGSGKNSRTSEYVLYESEQNLGGGAVESIPILFSIPPEARVTDLMNPRDRVLWRLEPRAKLSGVDLKLQFEVPVFAGAVTPALAASASRARIAEDAARSAYVPPANSRISIQTAAKGGTEYIFPAARNPGMALACTIISLGLGTGIYFLFRNRVPIFPIVLSLFEIIVIAAALFAWFRRTRVVIDSGSIIAMHDLLGIRWQQSAANSDVERVYTQANSSAGNTKYYDIKVAVRDKRNLIAGTGISDHQHAEWLAREMAKAIGLKS